MNLTSFKNCRVVEPPLACKWFFDWVLRFGFTLCSDLEMQKFGSVDSYVYLFLGSLAVKFWHLCSSCCFVQIFGVFWFYAASLTVFILIYLFRLKCCVIRLCYSCEIIIQNLCIMVERNLVSLLSIDWIEDFFLHLNNIIGFDAREVITFWQVV